ncbi:developmental checkpoint coupling sporulation initiation to replication initiation [Lentibacillus halodurans]|uniref:Developmental checkpoint coupling sporulation initiation to replication initiation n=1 Tax=Lentibacillus halodurans TaxID=237679 RepID=A0A1I0Y9W7_9BACI|nr:sporulation histidine kinase inhibitor Sda [Lentibacillus halodurans]SFB10185.1 developmental checkpoint coupling sporulation initiation to replication initiation [Lentibacillus halodurans]
MENISDELLIEIYQKAIELNLNYEFVIILRHELSRRSLKIH